jgi:hypothetical protein
VEFWEAVELKVIDHKVFNSEAVNLELVIIETVNWEPCVMEAETLFIG